MNKLDQALSLIDGVSEIVEIFTTNSPSQCEWKKNWLKEAKEILETPKDNFEFFIDFKNPKLDEDIQYVFEQYVKLNPNNLQKILGMITSFTQTFLEKQHETISEVKGSLMDIIHIHQELQGSSFKKNCIKMPDKYIVHYWRIVKTNFPKGTCKSHSTLEKEFFNVFLSNLKKSKQLINSDWAKSFGANNYLKLVLNLNK